MKARIGPAILAILGVFLLTVLGAAVLGAAANSQEVSSGVAGEELDALEGVHPATIADLPRLTPIVVTLDATALEEEALYANAKLELISNSGLTAQEADEKLMPDGKLDLLRCIEYVLIRQLRASNEKTLQLWDIEVRTDRAEPTQPPKRPTAASVTF